MCCAGLETDKVSQVVALYVYVFMSISILYIMYGKGVVGIIGVKVLRVYAFSVRFSNKDSPIHSQIFPH